MKTRLATILSDEQSPPRVRHYLGSPPELTEGRDTRQQMAPARVLLIDAEPGGVFLFRYDDEGQFAGDTWHRSIDEAKRQAAFEFEGLFDKWIDVPSEIEDVVAYCQNRFGKVPREE